MPVLITAGLSPQAHRLQRILNAKEVIFADGSPLPQIPGTHSITLPHFNSPSFIHEILKAALDNDIQTIYSLKRGEVLELSKARALFAEYNVNLIIPSAGWLANNLNSSGNTNVGNIVVLENGILKAGNLGPGQYFTEDTGIFWWATKEQKTEYNLYLEDAGI